MAQIKIVQAQKEIKCDADKFFHIWAHKPDLVSKLCPNRYTKIELHEGGWGGIGSVASWHYIAYGEHGFAKSKIEEIDESNKSVTYKYIDGQMLKKYYKHIQSKIQVIPKGNNNCIVKWTMEYEKLNNDAREADLYVDFLLACAKDLEACV